MWVCSMCGQQLTSRPVGWNRSTGTLKKALLVKVEDHIDFHVWQFGHEIDHQWLEEEQETEMDDD